MLATLLLSLNGVYVSDKGELPSREHVGFDKEVLAAIMRGNNVSQEGYKTLPPSIRCLVDCVPYHGITPVTIPEIAKADVILVTRSHTLMQGKSFRFDDFYCVLVQDVLELWIRKGG